MRRDVVGSSLLWRMRGSSVVVLQIEVADFTLPDIKGQPPIAADRNTPGARAVALQLVHAPAGRPDNAAHVGRRDQDRENVAQPPHKITAELPAVVVLMRRNKPGAGRAPDDHYGDVRRHRTPVKWRPELPHLPRCADGSVSGLD